MKRTVVFVHSEPRVTALLGAGALRQPVDRVVYEFECGHATEFAPGEPLPGEQGECERCNADFDPFAGIVGLDDIQQGAAGGREHARVGFNEGVRGGAYGW